MILTWLAEVCRLARRKGEVPRYLPRHISIMAALVPPAPVYGMRGPYRLVPFVDIRTLHPISINSPVSQYESCAQRWTPLLDMQINIEISGR